MKLMTQEVIKRLPPLGSQNGMKPEEVKIAVKFFAPWGSWTWYVIEGERTPDGDWEFFGLVRGSETELGYFRLSDLQSIRGSFGLGIERDRSFYGRTLAEAQASQI